MQALEQLLEMHHKVAFGEFILWDIVFVSCHLQKDFEWYV